MVFSMVKKEAEFAAFAAAAKALAARTRAETPDFRQSSDHFVPIYHHAMAVRPRFVAFFQGVADAAGAGCKFQARSCGPPRQQRARSLGREHLLLPITFMGLRLLLSLLSSFSELLCSCAGFV